MKYDVFTIARVISDGQLINCATKSDVAMNKATCSKIAYQLADVMARDNARFDGARFLKACGIAA